MRAGATYHVSRITVVFLGCWVLVWVLVCFVFWGGCCSLFVWSCFVIPVQYQDHRVYHVFVGISKTAPWQIESYLLCPSLWKSARAPSIRFPLTFSRRLLNPLLTDFLSFFFILDVVHFLTDFAHCSFFVDPLAVPLE